MLPFSFHEFDSVYFSELDAVDSGLRSLFGNDLIKHMRGMLSLLQVADEPNGANKTY